MVVAMNIICVLGEMECQKQHKLLFLSAARSYIYPLAHHMGRIRFGVDKWPWPIISEKS
jgi:hypothetical protein